MIVCPTQAIIAGDLDDPTSASIATTLARHGTRCAAPSRAPAQGLLPGRRRGALDPLRSGAHPTADLGRHPARPADRHLRRRRGSADDGRGGPHGRTPHVPHPPPWGRRSPPTCGPKSVAAGALLGRRALAERPRRWRGLAGIAAPVVALVFLALTACCSSPTSSNPSRFHYILLRPNWRSWLVRGAWILLAYGALALVWLLGGLLDRPGVVQAGAAGGLPRRAATAGYTAFLFGQAKGATCGRAAPAARTCSAQAVVAGAGARLCWSALFDAAPTSRPRCGGRWSAAVALLLLVAVGSRRSGTAAVELAARRDDAGRAAVRSGPSASGPGSWSLASPIIGLAAPARCAVTALPARLAALAGLYPYEDAFVRAGQAVPSRDVAARASSYPPARALGRLGGADAQAWPRAGRAPLLADPDDLLQLRGGVRAARLRRQADTGASRPFEGNPEHPGSRGRNCAKGPATLNQVDDPERILYPLKRAGRRGGGEWERVTWDEALDDIAGRIRHGHLVEGRRNEVMYHVGRPGDDGYIERVFHAWGIDGHNSHTNVCSAGARVGYAFWIGFDRPSPDHANADVILLLSAPRGRPLLQPPRPADHRGSQGAARGHRRRHAPVEHRLDGRLLAAALARHRGGAAPGDGPSARTSGTTTASSCAAG